ncbi:MAG TPA: hypothetical protein VFO19_04480 [Vicinamibacterales bacterium]|nr:hypothetical protein [Vicinamibacterales bacterium]
MTLSGRYKLPILCSGLALIVAACGGSPTEPSSPSSRATGAVVAGVVSGSSGSTATAGLSTSAYRPKATSSWSGLTVRVSGTNRSALVGDSGSFEIADVPPGIVKLQFTGEGVNATTEVADVSADQFVQLEVQLSASTALIVGDARTRKVSLCHAEGTGEYHLIDISESAEATHRGHGDAEIGEAVPGRPGTTFDSNCRPVGPAIDIEKLTNNEDADVAPGPRIPLGNTVTWSYVVKNIGTVNLTAVNVVDDRGVVVSCAQTALSAGASMTCTGTGIATALGPYQNLGTATAQWSTSAGSGTVTDSDPSHYLGVSPITIEKLTNGEEADTAPGPSIAVGSPVTWEYRLTNISTSPLTSVSVSDDRGVAVSCSQTSLGPGATMTCTGSGQAVLGQYSNIGTVTANWSAGGFSGTATASDPSHYLGVSEDEGPKVSLCHRTGAGFYVLISVGAAAEPAHLAHGDGRPGQAVPGSPGRSFSSGCSVQ